jgi:hypothetical protein
VPGYDRVFVMRRTFYSVNLMGKLRDAESNRSQFVDAARKLSVMLFNEALGMLPHTPRTITTPVDGAKYVTFEMPDPERFAPPASLDRVRAPTTDAAPLLSLSLVSHQEKHQPRHDSRRL